MMLGSVSRLGLFWLAVLIVPAFTTLNAQAKDDSRLAGLRSSSLTTGLSAAPHGEASADQPARDATVKSAIDKPAAVAETSVPPGKSPAAIDAASPAGNASSPPNSLPQSPPPRVGTPSAGRSLLAAPTAPCAKLYSTTALEHYLEDVQGFMAGEGVARVSGRLAQFDAGLLCAAQAVPGRLIARYFFLRAVAVWYRGDEAQARQLLRDAFALFPDLQWNGEVLGPGVDPRALILAFKEEREVILQQTIPARFVLKGGAPGQALYVDGEAYRFEEAAPHEIMPGRHLVQIPLDGPSFRTFWRELEPGKLELINVGDVQ